MARILITSGPTRQYLDPVRYLTNASSGKMGASLAEAALARGHEVTIVSGPVDVAYPPGAEVTRVVSTEEMLTEAVRLFERCDGVIGAAAPCDYRPVRVEASKIAKTGAPLVVNLIETDDVVATLGAKKGRRWVVGFALETEDHHLRAVGKLERKCCDLIVSNGVEAMHSDTNAVEVLDAAGKVVCRSSGDKLTVGRDIIAAIEKTLIRPETA